MNQKLYLSVGLILFFFFFASALTTYFVQDDFFLLSISRIDDLHDFFSFFIPRADQIWYRPVSSQVFFAISHTLFGLDPMPWHLLVFITHIGAGIMLYKILQHLQLSLEVRLTATLFYLFHQLHLVSLSWLATYSFIVGPLLIMSALYMYMKKRFVLSICFYILALGTTEVSIIFIPILFIYQRLIEKRLQKIFLPYVVLGISMLLLRYIVFPPERYISAYTLTISHTTVTTLKFYVLRLIGIPLGFDTIPFEQKLIIVSLSFILLLGILCGSLNKHRVKEKLFFIGLTLIGLGPFILLTEHIAPYYLSFALIGFAPFVGVSYEYMYRRFSLLQKRSSILVIGVIFFGLQWIGIQWTYNTHWIYTRAKLAEKLIKTRQFIHPVGTEEYFALGGMAALDVFETSAQ